MVLRNTEDRYGSVAIALHWTGALSVLLMLLTAAWIWVAPDHRAALKHLLVDRDGTVPRMLGLRLPSAQVHAA